MISVTVAAGEIQCTVEWDSKDWSPDVALDMARRAVASVVVACSEIEEQEPPDGEPDVTATGDEN